MNTGYRIPETGNCPATGAIRYPVSGIRFSERSSDLLNLVALDDVASLIAVEIVELDAALEAGADFVGVVLEALERGDFSFVHDLAAATQPRGGAASDLAFGDEAAGNKTFRERENLPHFGRAGLRFLDVRIEEI